MAYIDHEISAVDRVAFSILFRSSMRLLLSLCLVLSFDPLEAFVRQPSLSCRTPLVRTRSSSRSRLSASGDPSTTSVTSVEEASRILEKWDKSYNSDDGTANADATMNETRSILQDAVRLLNDEAARERSEDSLRGRCMLGICAASSEEGIATLKAWVTSLQLPRGLLHGMDNEGQPIEMEGSVYIKYNTGGVLSFADIRKSGMGFDSLWRPGDAMIEDYDGSYRGVYFQVELADGEFRQYLVPLDTFVIE